MLRISLLSRCNMSIRATSVHRKDRIVSSPYTSKACTSRHLYIRNLAWDVNWQLLKDHFKQAGILKYLYIFKVF